MKMLIGAIMGLTAMFIAITTVMAATIHEKTTFAGGCFWCMEQPFDEIPGVVSGAVVTSASRSCGVLRRDIDEVLTGAACMLIARDHGKDRERDAGAAPEGPPIKNAVSVSE